MMSRWKKVFGFEERGLMEHRAIHQNSTSLCVTCVLKVWLNVHFQLTAVSMAIERIPVRGLSATS